jgi:BirA family biotin operon repressor/biotin-[acetyl-CoA-carboxylase] ligase
MSNTDAGLIRQSLLAGSQAQLDKLEVFGSIASTNTYLMSQPAPAAGRFRVAIADHQTSGRGRHYRRWVSPPGAGLYLSFAYSFAGKPENIPSLTLAIGVGVIDALQDLGVGGVSLKWPNDVVALDSKLGGILTELQSRPASGVTVVTGVGLNVALPVDAGSEIQSDWAARTVDLSAICEELPGTSQVAAALLNRLHEVMRKFESYGFDGFVDRWSKYDWLRNRDITVEQAGEQLVGVAAGVDRDGALLVNMESGTARIVSGSVMVAGLAA